MADTKLSALAQGANSLLYYGVDFSGTSKKFNAPSILNVKDFGAKGDGTTDDTAAIQAAIDYAIPAGIFWVYIPDGTYKTSNTIHLGYGLLASVANFSTVGLIGTGGGYPLAGPTKIMPTFKDRPVINIQGARNITVKNLSIVGPTAAAINNNNVMSQTLAARAVANNYVPAGAKDDVNAPFCGICIDGYSGAVPANPYPTPVYPAWAGTAPNAYGKAPSSEILIERVYIENTMIGFMLKPNDQNNGDFTKFRDCEANSLKIAIEWGGSQTRNTDVQNFKSGACHTVFQSFGYGAGNGNMSGNFENISLGWNYRLIAQSLGWSGPMCIRDMYQEGGMIIGIGQDVDFYNCRFSYNGDSKFSGSTLLEIWREPQWQGRALFSGCDISGSMAFHFIGDVRFERCSFSYTSATATDADMYNSNSTAMKKSLDSFCQIFISTLPGLPKAKALTSMSKLFGLGAGHQTFTQCQYDGYDGFDALSMWGVGASIHCADQGLHLDYDYSLMDCFGFAAANGAVSLSGRTLTFPANQNYYQPGDVLHFTGTGGNWWSVDNQSGISPFTVTAYPLTNVAWNGSIYTLLNSNNATGNMYHMPVGVLDLDAADAPFAGLFMSTTVGSPTISFVDGSGAAANRPARCTTASRPLWFGKSADVIARIVPFPQSTVPISVAAQSVTMNANALVTGTYLYCPGIKRIK